MSAAEIFDQRKVKKKKKNYYLRREEFVSLHARIGIINLVISRKFKLDEAIETSHTLNEGKIMVMGVISP
ncbi:MAG: hypothetical protein M3286_01660 [Thermoproteota archaeon]|nr:hypothetical protein [Thermoproteota archaeon]